MPDSIPKGRGDVDRGRRLVKGILHAIKKPRGPKKSRRTGKNGGFLRAQRWGKTIRQLKTSGQLFCGEKGSGSREVGKPLKGDIEDLGAPGA